MPSQKKHKVENRKSPKNTFEGDHPDKESKSSDLICVDNEINIILVGNRNVGKTSFLFKYAINMYSELYQPTSGIDFRNVIVETHLGKKVNVKFWDTPGSDKSHALLKDVYGIANGFIVIYDVTDIQSYNDVYQWMVLIKKFSLDKAQVVVIGNKTDLVAHRKLSKEEGMRLAASYDAKFMETNIPHKKNIQNTIKRMTSNLSP